MGYERGKLQGRQKMIFPVIQDGESDEGMKKL